MKQVVLTIPQMKHLMELGLDIKDAHFTHVQYPPSMEGPGGWKIVESSFTICPSFIVSEGHMPAYTLQEVIDKLPESIRVHRMDYTLRLIPLGSGKGILFEYVNSENIRAIQISDENALTSAYLMLCWCLRNKF